MLHSAGWDVLVPRIDSGIWIAWSTAVWSFWELRGLSQVFEGVCRRRSLNVSCIASSMELAPSGVVVASIALTFLLPK